MFDRDGRLDIFENFVVDGSLPKFGRGKPVASNNGFIISTADTSTVMTRQVFITQSGSGNWRTESSGSKESSGSWWQRLVAWWREKRRMPVEQFFASVRNGVEELEVVEARMKGYLAAIEQARKNGQTALAEQLEAAVEGVRAETQMVAAKQTKYITEEQLVAFVKKAKKGLRLDWLKNFTRVIPENVVKVKVAADERGIFDNYVVLHYDPQKKAWAETKEEKERRKDPILFGVVKGRRRLYFVGDWVDEFCDLTLDQLAEVLGETPKEVPTAFVVEAGPL